jgi:hypothetical protein
LKILVNCSKCNNCKKSSNQQKPDVISSCLWCRDRPACTSNDAMWLISILLAEKLNIFILVSPQFSKLIVPIMKFTTFSRWWVRYSYDLAICDNNQLCWIIYLILYHCLIRKGYPLILCRKGFTSIFLTLWHILYPNKVLLMSTP